MTTIDDLIQTFDVLLFDAYGVLLNEGGALPGARELIDFLNQQKKEYLILSNGSRHPLVVAQGRYQALGLSIPLDRIHTSGSLVGPWVKEKGFTGKKAHILGPPSSQVIAQEAGLRIWERTDPEPPRVIVIMDQDGWEIIPECDRIVSMAYQCQKNGVPLELLLPNPDIIYPDKKGTFGLTSGAIALMIEGALKVLLGENAPSFQGLGKPHSPLFDKAKSLYPNKTMVMIGDQKNTDIEGALRAGLKAALVLTGVSSGEDPGGAHFILQDLRMS